MDKNTNAQQRILFHRTAHVKFMKMVKLKLCSFEPRLKALESAAPFISATPKRQGPSKQVESPPICVWQGGFLGVEKPNATHES